MERAAREPLATCPLCRTPQRRLFTYEGFHYHRCPRCRLVSTYPLPDPATIAAHYARRFAEGNYRLIQDFASEYQAVYRGTLRYLARTLATRGRVLAGQSVLDVGCFTGDFLQLLAAEGADVHGLELQAEAVEIANRRLPGRVVRGDRLDGVLAGMRFDVVTLLAVIEHVPDPLDLLSRCRDLLRPGGLLLVETPDSGSLLARGLGRWWPPYAPVEHIHLFSARGARLALESLGFEGVRVQRHWKQLPIAYVYAMLRSFGPEFHRLLTPAYRILPAWGRRLALPFYVGEMLMAGWKAAT